MLAARALLDRVTDMIAEFRGSGRLSVPEVTVEAQYVAVVALLRSVGHVLDKVDCVEGREKGFLKSRWPEWKKEDIFARFIEPTRNELLKEFKNGLRLQQTNDLSHGVVANPAMPSGATIVINFDPDKLTDVHGRRVLPLFDDAVAYCSRCLQEFEGYLSQHGGAKG